MGKGASGGPGSGHGSQKNPTGKTRGDREHCGDNALSGGRAIKEEPQPCVPLAPRTPQRCHLLAGQSLLWKYKKILKHPEVSSFGIFVGSGVSFLERWNHQSIPSVISLAGQSLLWKYKKNLKKPLKKRFYSFGIHGRFGVILGGEFGVLGSSNQVSPLALSLLSPDGKQEGIWDKKMGNGDSDTSLWGWMDPGSQNFCG